MNDEVNQIVEGSVGSMINEIKSMVAFQSSTIAGEFNGNTEEITSAYLTLLKEQLMLVNTDAIMRSL